jgi:hypothetical protein
MLLHCYHIEFIFRQSWVDATLDFSGNWTSSGNYMFLSGYSDMRHAGSWADDLPAKTVNTTGIIVGLTKNKFELKYNKLFVF